MACVERHAAPLVLQSSGCPADLGENRGQPSLQERPDELGPVGLVDLLERRCGTGESQRRPRPSPPRRQSGECTQPDRDGESVTQLDDRGHGVGERSLGSDGVIQIEMDHAEELAAPAPGSPSGRRRC